jgi:hypothetical protein
LLISPEAKRVKRKAAEAPAEQSHRDSDEGKVVPDGRGINASEADLEDQARKSKADRDE